MNRGKEHIKKEGMQEETTETKVLEQIYGNLLLQKITQCYNQISYDTKCAKIYLVKSPATG